MRQSNWMPNFYNKLAIDELFVAYGHPFRAAGAP